MDDLGDGVCVDARSVGVDMGLSAEFDGMEEFGVVV